jgi:DNA-binding MarR family transcriptional regulator
MKYFTMKDFSTHSSEPKYHGNLVCDENGCLYDERLRSAMAAEAGTGISMASVEAIVAIRSAARAIHINVERWADRHGLSEGRLAIVMVLKRSPGNQMPLGQLADMIESTPRNVTGLVDNLERAGLVERVPDPQDRRSVLARLTRAGLEKVTEIWQEAFEQRHNVTKGLTEEELVQLRHLAFKLVQSMSAAQNRAPEEVAT